MACAVAAGAVLTVTTFGQDNTTPQYLGSPLNCLYGWLMCLTMMGWFKARYDKTGTFAGYMTRSSFGLYIVHYLVVASLGYMMKMYTQLPPVAMYVILTVAVFTLSPLLYQLLKRIPCRPLVRPRGEEALEAESQAHTVHARLELQAGIMADIAAAIILVVVVGNLVELAAAADPKGNARDEAGAAHDAENRSGV